MTCFCKCRRLKIVFFFSCIRVSMLHTVSMLCYVILNVYATQRNLVILLFSDFLLIHYNYEQLLAQPISGICITVWICKILKIKKVKNKLLMYTFAVCFYFVFCTWMYLTYAGLCIRIQSCALMAQRAHYR